MDSMNLSARKQQILRSVIDAHIKYGEPVGSKYLAGSVELACSSATIRNEMAEMEAMGLLEQPHTSAGRVPTELGYRYYVNSLLENYSSTIGEIEQMSSALKRKIGELDQILAEAGRIASAVTNYPSIAMKSRPGSTTVARFDGVYISDSKYLLIMMFDSSAVKTRTVHSEQPIAEEDLLRLISQLNRLITHRTAEDINLPVIVELESSMGELAPLASQAVKTVYDTMQEMDTGELRVEGVNRLLQYPEYENVDELRSMISLFENKEGLFSSISAEDGSDERVHVLIGSDIQSAGENSALIYRPVKRDGKVVGAIGVIGPRRMDYAKVISTIDNLAAGLDRLLNDPSLPEPEKGKKHD